MERRKAVLIISLVCGLIGLCAPLALSQNYEVRTFLADPSMATTDPTYQFLYNSLRQRYVCPYCAFSRETPGICPNPWQIAGHPGNVALRDMGAQPQQRVLSLAAPAMPADKGDVLLPDEAGNLVWRALLGRPYKPRDADGNVVRARLYAAATGLINNNPAQGPVIAAGTRLRWLVIPPTPLRREEKPGEPTDISYGLPQRKPFAQPDPGTANGGDDSWRPQVLAANAGTNPPITPAMLPDYLTIGVNPYRVDDGDYWWIRYRERVEQLGGGNMRVREVYVELYSVLYGLQGSLHIAPSGGPQLVNYPFSFVADSGAIVVTFEDGGDGEPGWSIEGTGGSFYTWVVGFMVRSNCRLIPGWRDLYNPSVDPPFPKDRDGNLNPGNGGFNLLTDPFPGAKQCWIEAVAGAPNITTDSPVAQTNNPPQPYFFPPNATGLGLIAVEWGGEDDTQDIQPDPTGNNPAGTVYYRNGLEWQYDAGISGGTVTQITNAEVAARTANYSATYPYVRLLAARYFVTRPEAPRTNTAWDKNGDGTADEPAELSALPLAYPKIILGQVRGALVQGHYAPGSVTARRSFALLNRWSEGDATRVCPVCGEVFPPGAAIPQCPYHSVPPSTITELTVSGAGTPGYNGIYTRQATLVNGYPYFQHTSGGYFIYYSAPPKKRWLMSTSTAHTFQQAAYWNLQLTGTYNPRTGTGNPVVVVSGYSSEGAVQELAAAGGGAYEAQTQIWREATAIGQDERQNPPVVARHIMPAQAFKSVKRPVPAHCNVNTPAAGQLWAEIPRYQPPSVPGSGLASDYANDFGYRGGLAIYVNEKAPHYAEKNLNTSSPLSRGWDVFYRNPDNGYFQPRPGVWPFICPGPTASPEDDHIVWATAAGNCPLHNVATTEAPGRHYFCPVCGAEYPEPGTCSFDGAAITSNEQIPLNLAVREEHLVAEEFEPFEVQVSVNRTGELAQTASTVNLGRITPGTAPQQPDATTGMLTDHRAFPADMTPLPRTAQRPSDARAPFRNEGNVALSLRLGNMYDFNESAIADRGLDDYLRIEVDPLLMSYGRKAQSGPLTRDTFMPWIKNPGGSGFYEGDLLSRALWEVLAPGPERMAGEDSWMAAGNPARLPAAGFITAGSYGGRPTAKPVPLGQPVGTYAGGHLQYVDVNGNGVFDFRHWNGSAFVDTNSGVMAYNPATDLPLEPFVGTVQGLLRVFESRLPQSDYYAADNDPIVLPSPTPGVMQIIWASNRRSADPGQSGYNAGATPGGTGPADLPTSTTPFNLLYVTTTGYTGGANDPLYRRYIWPTDASGRIAAPRALTDDPAGTVNSRPWAMWDAAGNKWAFWHRSLRHAGGVERTLRYNGPLAGASWDWDPAADRFIYDTGLNKQGLRGFWQPNGAWLFWHEGAPGRERLKYRWDFDGTPTTKEAVLPVTNAAGAGTSDLVNAVLPDGNRVVIRKPALSPFTYTRDVSVFTHAGLMHVFFSGFVTHEGQADICWAKFELARMGANMSPNDNYAKRPFPQIADEEMEADGLHQLFASRHLDWLVGRGPTPPGATTTNIPAFDPNDGFSPRLWLQLGYEDTIGDGQPRPAQTFQISWENNPRVNYYDRARGVYCLTPILVPVGGATLPATCAIDRGDGTYYIRDPHSGATPRPLTMEINPAAGTVQFSAPLFNEDAPNDPVAAFKASDAFNGAALNDVVLHISYIPYIYRVTRSEAQDDSPSAFYDPSTGARLTVFWRRSYPTSEAPHFGRPTYMYRCYTTSIQVGRPPVQGNATITEWFTNAPVVVGTSDADAGLYTIDIANCAAAIRALFEQGQLYLKVEYNDGTTTRIERHQVIGWSQEMIVPIDTVIGEGALVAVPEAFSVPAAEGSSANIPAVRYWLFWSSPRGVYDLRLVENTGSRAAGDLAIHPSSDIYMAVIAPEFGSLMPERIVPTILPNPT